MTVKFKLQALMWKFRKKQKHDIQYNTRVITKMFVHSLTKKYLGAKNKMTTMTMPF